MSEFCDYRWKQLWTEEHAPFAELSLRPAAVIAVGEVQRGYTETYFEVYTANHVLTVKIRHNCQGEFSADEVQRELELTRLQIIKDARRLHEQAA